MTVTAGTKPGVPPSPGTSPPPQTHPTSRSSTSDHVEAVPASTPTSPSPTDGQGRPWPVFAHASEAEMARILDFYAVRWDYEPRTFPILWNLEGDVVESFSPDFYLPELDLYLEMTTLKQRLVRKKNRKLRRLRELYPAIRIKLFYARDFRAIMLKYGRLALVESLSGTLGQIIPDHSPRELVAVLAASRPVPESAPRLVRQRRRRSRGTPSTTADMLASAPAGAAGVDRVHTQRELAASEHQEDRGN